MLQGTGKSFIYCGWVQNNFLNKQTGGNLSIHSCFLASKLWCSLPLMREQKFCAGGCNP